MAIKRKVKRKKSRYYSVRQLKIRNNFTDTIRQPVAIKRDPVGRGKNLLEFFNKDEWLKKMEGWIWLVLLISTVFYLKWLLIEANLETKKLMGEREEFQLEISKQQKRMQNINDQMQAAASAGQAAAGAGQAQINNPVEEFMKKIRDGRGAITNQATSTEAHNL